MSNLSSKIRVQMDRATADDEVSIVFTNEDDERVLKYVVKGTQLTTNFEDGDHTYFVTEEGIPVDELISGLQRISSSNEEEF